MTTTSPTFPPRMRWILWASLLMSVVVYFGVLNLAAPDPERSGAVQPLMVRFPEWMAVAGLLLVAVAIGIKYVVRNRIGKGGKPEAPPWADQAYIISLALVEAPAVLGLLLGLQGAKMTDYLPLFVLSLVGFGMLLPAFFFPRDPPRVRDLVS